MDRTGQGLASNPLTLSFTSPVLEGEYLAEVAKRRWPVLLFIFCFDVSCYIFRISAKCFGPGMLSAGPVLFLRCSYGFAREFAPQLANMAVLYFFLGLLNKRSRRLGDKAARQEEVLLSACMALAICSLLASLSADNCSDYVYVAFFLICTSTFLKIRWWVGTLVQAVPTGLMQYLVFRHAFGATSAAALGALALGGGSGGANLTTTSSAGGGGCVAPACGRGAAAAAAAEAGAGAGAGAEAAGGSWLDAAAGALLPPEAGVHVAVAWAVGGLMAYVADWYRRQMFAHSKLAALAYNSELTEAQARIAAQRALAAAQAQAAQRALSVAREKAANEAKSDFMSLMCHEVRTPLNGCLASAEMLLETPLQAEQRELAATIRVSGSILLSTVSNFLDFFKLEAGKALDVVRTATDLRQMVADVQCIIEAMLGRGGEVALLTPNMQGLWCQRVYCDADRVRGILLNLYTNAAKFTRQGHIQLAVREVPAGYTPEPLPDYGTIVVVPPAYTHRKVGPPAPPPSAAAAAVHVTALQQRQWQQQQAALDAAEAPTQQRRLALAAATAAGAAGVEGGGGSAYPLRAPEQLQPQPQQQGRGPVPVPVQCVQQSPGVDPDADGGLGPRRGDAAGCGSSGSGQQASGKQQAPHSAVPPGAPQCSRQPAAVEPAPAQHSERDCGDTCESGTELLRECPSEPGSEPCSSGGLEGWQSPLTASCASPASPEAGQPHSSGPELRLRAEGGSTGAPCGEAPGAAAAVAAAAAALAERQQLQQQQPQQQPQQQQHPYLQDAHAGPGPWSAREAAQAGAQAALRRGGAGRLADADAPGAARWLLFEVADTGVGISQEGLNTLFREYVQGTEDEMRKPRSKGGTGLGLAICSKQVGVLGGRIGAYSRPGHGSVFWFTIPLIEAPPADGLYDNRGSAPQPHTGWQQPLHHQVEPEARAPPSSPPQMSPPPQHQSYHWTECRVPQSQGTAAAAGAAGEGPSLSQSGAQPGTAAAAASQLQTAVQGGAVSLPRLAAQGNGALGGQCLGLQQGADGGLPAPSAAVRLAGGADGSCVPANGVASGVSSAGSGEVGQAALGHLNAGAAASWAAGAAGSSRGGQAACGHGLSLADRLDGAGSQLPCSASGSHAGPCAAAALAADAVGCGALAARQWLLAGGQGGPSCGCERDARSSPFDAADPAAGPAACMHGSGSSDCLASEGSLACGQGRPPCGLHQAPAGAPPQEPGGPRGDADASLGSAGNHWLFRGSASGRAEQAEPSPRLTPAAATGGPAAVPECRLSHSGGGGGPDGPCSGMSVCSSAGGSTGGPQPAGPQGGRHAALSSCCSVASLCGSARHSTGAASFNAAPVVPSALPAPRGSRNGFVSEPESSSDCGDRWSSSGGRGAFAAAVPPSSVPAPANGGAGPGAAAAAMGAVAGVGGGRQPPRGDFGRLAGRRVLLVEDNLINQTVATKMLASLGMRAELASNGLEAVRAVERVMAAAAAAAAAAGPPADAAVQAAGAEAEAGNPAGAANGGRAAEGLGQSPNVSGQGPPAAAPHGASTSAAAANGAVTDGSAPAQPAGAATAPSTPSAPGPDPRSLLLGALSGGGRPANARAPPSNEPFDVILMDMAMPVMGGVEATRAIRRLGCPVPILAMTANASDRDRDECRLAGMDGFLSKPVLKDRLADSLLRVLDGAGWAQHGAAPGGEV